MLISQSLVILEVKQFRLDPENKDRTVQWNITHKLILM